MNYTSLRGYFDKNISYFVTETKPKLLFLESKINFNSNT